MAIEWLLKWTPFKIDALGLVTLLGAEDVNRAVGRLSRSRWTEYLPLVGGFVIASDSIRSPISGFALYNISDGICATDVTGWFSRWLLSQDLTYNSTTLIISVLHRFNLPNDCVFPAACLGSGVSFVLILLPALMTDWWGLANAISLGIAVIVRSVIVKTNREAVDRLAEGAVQQSRAVVKSFLKLPDGCSVTIYAPRGLVTECLLTTPRPANTKVYLGFRYLGWVVFLIHVLSLGMAALPNQLLTVTTLAASTVCVLMGVASNNELIGSRILIRRSDHLGGDKSMAAAFARLRLTPSEEESMGAWRLVPQRSNELWWRKYRDSLARNSPLAFETWKEKQTWTVFENLLLEEANRSASFGSTPNSQGAANP